MKIQAFLVIFLMSVLANGHRRYYKGYSKRGPVYQPSFMGGYPSFHFQNPFVPQLQPNPQQQIPQQFPQFFPQIPIIPQMPRPDGFPVLRELVEPGTPTNSNGGNVISNGNCQVTGCSNGQFCVLEDHRVQNEFYLCTSFMKEPCQCVQGCQHKMTFIPFGQSRVIDTCGNKCTCNSVYGTADCEARSCFNSPFKSTKK